MIATKSRLTVLFITLFLLFAVSGCREETAGEAYSAIKPSADPYQDCLDIECSMLDPAGQEYYYCVQKCKEQDSYGEVPESPQPAPETVPDHVSVTDFGAIPDDAQSDSPAISQAIASGENIHFPAGTYMIDSMITIEGRTGLHLYGEGTLKFTDGLPTGIRMFEIIDCHDVLIEGLEFDGNKANLEQPPTNQHWNSGLPRIYYTPINLVRSTDVTVRDCNFHDVSTSAINLDESMRIDIENNRFHDSYMDPIFTHRGIGNSDVTITGNDIRCITLEPNCDVLNPAHTNRYGNGMIVDADNLLVANNRIERVDRSCLKPIDQPKNNIVVRDNHLIECAGFGINPQAGSDITITNNLIERAGHGGINAAVSARFTSQQELDARKIRNLLIEGNTVKQTGMLEGAPVKEGITLGNHVGDAIVRGNTVEEASTRGIRTVNVEDALIENNRIDGAGVTLITVLGSGGKISTDVTIRNNELLGRGTTTNGVRVEDATEHVLIEGNEITGTTHAGILITTAATGTIEILRNSMSDPGNRGVLALLPGIAINGNDVSGSAPFTACYQSADPLPPDNTGTVCRTLYLPIT